MADQFLAGVRVLEIGDGIAGSAAAAMLAGLGAHVTKVSPGAPRRVGPSITTPAGRIAALDLTLDRGKEMLDAGADVTSLRADITIVDGAEVDLAGHPVAVRITPFGLDGPRSGQPGGELVAQAAGGMLATIDGRDGKPVPAPGYVALKAAGMVAALAAMHGLDRHLLLGSPVEVDVSVQEAVAFTAALPECAHVLYACPGRAGSGRYLAPSGTFGCRDGLVRITAVENHQWKGLLAALEYPAWAAGFDERSARIDHAALINQHVTEWTSTREKAACAALLQANGVPSTPVNTPAEVLASPQFAHRGAFSDHAAGERTLAVLGNPWVTHSGRPTAGTRTGRLADLRVVELTHVLAGPIVGSLLGAMGARVVRLEFPDRLDIYRRTGPFAGGRPGVERGAYFSIANHSKQSLLIDPLRTDVGAVIEDSDVLIENVGSARLDRLAVHPPLLGDSGRLTMRVSGFGSAGPLAGYRVYANNVQSYGGLTGLTNDATGAPARLGTVLADPLSSVVAATVIAAWAIGPGRDTGAVIDLSMAEVVASTVAEFITAASVPDSTPEAAVHRGVYPAADDRWVAVEQLGDATGLADLAAGMPAADAAQRLNAAGATAAVVQRAEDLVADAHLAARGFFPEIDHPDPDLDSARLVGLPWRFVGAGPIPLAPPPALGSANARYERTIHAG